MAAPLPAPAGSGPADALVGGHRARPPLVVVVPTEAELVAHIAYLEVLDRESKGRCMWLALAREEAA
jgi:hypothetical protein